MNNLTSIIDHIAKSPNQNPQALNYLRDGKWVSFSTAEFTSKIKNLALALAQIEGYLAAGLAIIANPSPIWLIVDFAALSIGAISVPIFPNIAKDNMLFELEDADIKTVFCDSLETLGIIQDSGRKFSKIIIDDLAIEFWESAANIVKLSDLFIIGEKIIAQNPSSYQNLISKIKENDLATIIYTSGATGRPKGVELTHKNLISQIKATAEIFPLQAKFDIALSFLPLAHIFERMVMGYYINSGISIYFVDDVKNLGEIIKEIRPTLITTVPRMLEKIYGKIKNNINESNIVTKIIGRAALLLALNQNPKMKIPLLHQLFDFLVYKKLRTKLGGRLKTMICGSAALSLSLEKFFNNIGINLFIGYGLTESSPVIAVNSGQFSKLGTVGRAFPGVEVKLSEDGELFARGANIMSGYHNDRKKTKETISEDGWLGTGDLASIDEEAYIKIIGRKKELFKTSTGKYVSPVPIEAKLLELGSEFLAAAMIIAEGRKFVSCLLFADFDLLAEYKNKLDATNLSDKEFLDSEIFNNKIAALINKINNDLNHWEQIKKFDLIKKPISISSGELTPSMKLRRSAIEEKYKNEIAKFYQ